MKAVYYRAADGTEPVNAFIEELPIDVQEELDYTIELLNRLGPNDPPLPFPFSSQVAGQLRELRCHYGRRLFRVLYRRSEGLFVLLHIFEKRSAKAPAPEIDIAEVR